MTKFFSILISAFIAVCPLIKAVQDPSYIELALRITPAALVALTHLNQVTKQKQRTLEKSKEDKS